MVILAAVLYRWERESCALLSRPISFLSLFLLVYPGPSFIFLYSPFSHFLPVSCYDDAIIVSLERLLTVQVRRMHGRETERGK